MSYTDTLNQIIENNRKAATKARLECAAPDLLAACQNATEELMDDGTFDEGQLRQIIADAQKMLRAAIAKATGEGI